MEMMVNEPPRDKTNKVSVRSAKTQISLGIRLLSTQRRLSSDWADAADLSLRWAHSHFVGFVMSRLKYAVEYRYCDYCIV